MNYSSFCFTRSMPGHKFKPQTFTKVVRSLAQTARAENWRAAAQPRISLEQQSE